MNNIPELKEITEDVLKTLCREALIDIAMNNLLNLKKHGLYVCRYEEEVEGRK